MYLFVCAWPFLFLLTGYNACMPKVIIYSTPYCVYCKAAKEFFQENGVEYEEKDVAKDEEARERMIHKSGQLGVPVIEVGDDVVVGFDKNRLAALLNVR